MDYKAMWESLKEKITKDIEYHKSGVMQSMHESIQGESKSREILGYMTQIENTQPTKRVYRGVETDIPPFDPYQHVTHDNLGAALGMDVPMDPIFEVGAKVVDPFTGKPINATGDSEINEFSEIIRPDNEEKPKTL